MLTIHRQPQPQPIIIQIKVSMETRMKNLVQRNNLEGKLIRLVVGGICGVREQMSGYCRIEKALTALQETLKSSGFRG